MHAMRSAAVVGTSFSGLLSRMGVLNSTQEMDEFPREENKERGWMDWILRRALAMCKKMLVAGIVISSAPIVLPPLVVASALGFIVSLPYGMILASYTWSEKLLNKLLPGTSRDLLKEDGYELVYREAEEDYEFGGVLGMDEVQEMKSDETKEDIEARNIPSEEPRDEVIQGLILTVEANEGCLCDSGEVDASFKMTHVVNGEDLASTNDKMLDNGVSGEMFAETDMKSNGRKGKKKGRKKERASDKKLPKAGDDSKEIKSRHVKSAAAGADAKEDHPYYPKDEEKIKTSVSLPVHSLAGVKAPKVETNLDQKVILPSPDKDIYTEEGIWQKIDAMRRVVGYKAARQASCMEELRALYLFTGVEPPASFKDASDLKEVKEKLHFLLSVVGVE
ncbi:hypothetical protein MLD38_012080 [Melastoma candidum]|uniref:Uncharacterized protein n=1 Tax=Melastoma candidum TaxID=119954 RepID=A0ACB9R566_9MYRT|nr:hypothetical protein MLD38_012080 [Melastoma candidum]